ncbi:hypothetical protein PM082_000367 [Marasmius tenuissimus]|nr:hypothetical protein PM082_000367 [Marasmius tenuissimus]
MGFVDGGHRPSYLRNRITRTTLKSNGITNVRPWQPYPLQAVNITTSFEFAGNDGVCRTLPNTLVLADVLRELVFL